MSAKEPQLNPFQTKFLPVCLVYMVCIKPLRSPYLHRDLTGQAFDIRRVLL